MYDLNQTNKELVWDLWAALDAADPTARLTAARATMTQDIGWHAHAPVGSVVGPDAMLDRVWEPLRCAVPDMQRETFIFFGGRSNGRIDGDASRDGHMWVTGTGVLRGTFSNDYIGIPATGEPIAIRWGEFCRVADGRIDQTFFLIDVVDLMEQAGIGVLPQPRGEPGLYPPPAAGDGIMHGRQDDATTSYSVDHIRRFIFDGLNAFDESDLSSMGMADYFHPDVHWYGPGGIGACVSFREFEQLHQAPWLAAYPDRAVQDLDALFAEGAYTGAAGWAGVKATHIGTYLDTPATGRGVEFNGLDWWKRVDEQYVENWVFVDMVHLFTQFGVDLFERMRVQVAQRDQE